MKKEYTLVDVNLLKNEFCEHICITVTNLMELTPKK